MMSDHIREDFWEANPDKPKRWIGYYGEYAHAHTDCPEFDHKTYTRVRSSRPPCPECCDI